MGTKRNPIYDIAYQSYIDGLSLGQIAKNIGVTRQCVFKAFKKRGLQLRDRMCITPIGYEAMVKNGQKISQLQERKFRKYQIYNSEKFTLRNNGYFGLTKGQRILMHRYVWQNEKGIIPIGYDIHHIDENKENNAIDNLECLSKSEHTRKYSPHNNQYTKGRKCK